MDGQYGCISFICSQTDDIEATETLADHQEVAEKLGCWEKLQQLSDKLSALEMQQNDHQQEDDALKFAYEDAKDMVDEAERELEEATDEDTFRHEDESVDVENLEQLQKNLDVKRKAESVAMQELEDWRKGNIAETQKLSKKTLKYQRRLKALCAKVRNEYSKTCLQEDFRAGIDELVRGTDGEDAESGREGIAQLTPIPEDFQMDVFCISANDYLKLQGIKPSSDGPPNTFSKVADTQIPALREFVHKTTATFRASYSESFVDSASNILDQIKLVASDGNDTPSGRISRRYKASFDESTERVDEKVKAIVDDFSDKIGTYEMCPCLICLVASPSIPFCLTFAIKCLSNVAHQLRKSRRHSALLSQLGHRMEMPLLCRLFRLGDRPRKEADTTPTRIVVVFISLRTKRQSDATVFTLQALRGLWT